MGRRVAKGATGSRRPLVTVRGVVQLKSAARKAVTVFLFSFCYSASDNSANRRQLADERDEVAEEQTLPLGRVSIQQHGRTVEGAIKLGRRTE